MKTLPPSPRTPFLRTPIPAPVPLSVDAKKIVEVDLNLPGPPEDVTLDEGRYYVPTASNDPLFDSFMVHRSKNTIIISIIQITVSKTHGGSGKGYSSIRKIVKHVKNLAETDVPIKVVFVLACPKDGEEYEWKMPDEWDKETSDNDHRGPAFCLRVPVSGKL